MEDGKDELSLLDLIIVILKRRKLIISSFLIGSLIAGIGIAYVFLNQPKTDFVSIENPKTAVLCKTELILQSALMNNLNIDLSVRAESYLMSGEIQKLLSIGNSLLVKYEPTKKVISYTISGANAENLQENSKAILNALTFELREYLNNAINLVIAKQESELELKPDVILKNPNAYIVAVRKMAESEALYISLKEHEISSPADNKLKSYTTLLIIPIAFLFLSIMLAFLIEYFSKIKSDPVLYEHFLQESRLKKIRKE